MPTPVDPERFRRAEDLFHELLEADPATRQERLEQEEPELANEVRSLLAAYEEPADLLETTARRALGGASGEEADDPWTGRRVGAYRLEGKLGEGGMGVVYLARRADDEYDSAVSIKLLRHSLGGEALESRFRRERQILAQLDHPNIARLHDGGSTAEGVPYFVMDYVEGTALDRHCDAARLEPRERVEIFLQVCSAVAYAHRRLVVHRDIKPANILVTEEGSPKLLDFGIAKLLETDRAGEEATLTEAGMRPLTPRYASPEQIRGETITTASDIFSLGVTLYRLLAGQAPERPTPDSSPPPASESLSPDSFPGQQGSAWQRAVTGDLDLILRKAMAPEAEERYSSVDALADDLRRWLAGEPILARPPSVLYRLRRFAGRNRLSFGLLTALALLLIGYAATATYFSLRLASQNEAVRAEQARAERASAFLEETFAVADPESGQGAEITAGEVLRRGADRVERELVDQPLLQARLHFTIAGLFGKLGLFDEAARHFEKSLELRRRHLGEEDLESLLALSELGNMRLEVGSFAEAERLLQEAAVGFGGHGEVGRVERARSLARLAMIAIRRGDLVSAQEQLEESLALRRRAAKPAPLEIGNTVHSLGMVALHHGDLGGAEALFEEALSTRSQVVQRHHPEQLTTLKSLAQVLRRQGRVDEARALNEEILAAETEIWGPEHPRVAFSLAHIGSLAIEEGDLERAESLLLRALAMRRKLLGDLHPAISPTLASIGDLRRSQGRLQEAEEAYRESLRIGRATFGPASPTLAYILQPLGLMLVGDGRATDAEPLLREAYRLRQSSGAGPTTPIVLRSGGSLGRCLVALGRLDEAEELLLPYYAWLSKEGDSAELAGASEELSRLYDRRGDAEKAAELRSVALEVRRRLEAGTRK